MPGKKGGSGSLQWSGFPVLRVLLLYLLVELLLPVILGSLSFPGPKTSVPCLWLEPRHGPEELTVGPQGPELLRPNSTPTKPKRKAKAGLGCEAEAEPELEMEPDYRARPATPRPANGSRSDAWKRPWQRLWQRPASV